MSCVPKALLSCAVLLATVPALAAPPAGQYYNGGYQQHDYHDRQDFDRGLRDGARGGSYYDNRHASDGYDQRWQQNQGYYHGDPRYRDNRGGGIGPGKGALIGAAGGAVLGTLFGGGLKGTIIGGAAGAGIGAAVGEAHQNDRRHDQYYGR